MDGIARSAASGRHVYCKQMGKFATCVRRSWLKEGVHVVLVRDPVAVISSFGEVLETTLEETCYPALCCIVSELRALGKKPLVLLSEDIMHQPEATLRALCLATGIAWDPAMLKWPQGPKPYDGVWAPWWYKAVHGSSGWVKPSSASKAAPQIADALKPLLHECHVLYALLQPYALQPEQLPQELKTPMRRVTDAAFAAAPPSPSPGAPRSGVAADKSGTHVYKQDARNADILVGMRDGVSGRFRLTWRPHATVSVLDSGFMLGDGVWEGVRLHRGVLMFAREHLARLYQGAKAIGMDVGLPQEELQALLYHTADSNGMREASGVHIRLMVTRGLKPTPYQNPDTTIGQPTIVIVPEWKEASTAPKEHGITLHTVHVRRGAPDVQDQALNSHSKLNCITACVAANAAGADEGLMLDPQGFVATCNSVNFFIVVRTWHTILAGSHGDSTVEVWAPTTKHQLAGVTRANVLHLCRAHGIPYAERDISLTSVYSAEEAFVTGTFAGLLPVRQIDGRQIGNGKCGPVCERLQQTYVEAMDAQAAQGRLVLS